MRQRAWGSAVGSFSSTAFGSAAVARRCFSGQPPQIPPFAAALSKEYLLAGGDVDTAVANTKANDMLKDLPRLRDLLDIHQGMRYVALMHLHSSKSQSGDDLVMERLQLPSITLDQMDQPGAFVKPYGVNDKSEMGIHQGRFDGVLRQMCGPTLESAMAMDGFAEGPRFEGRPKLASLPFPEADKRNQWTRVSFVGLYNATRGELAMEALVAGEMKNHYLPFALAKKALLINFDKQKLYSSPVANGEAMLPVNTAQMFVEMTLPDIAKLTAEECAERFPVRQRNVFAVGMEDAPPPAPATKAK